MMTRSAHHRSVPVADGSVKKPARPQKEPFLGVRKCIPSPLGSRIAPPGAMFSRASFMIRGPVGFFTDPYARGSGCSETALGELYGAVMAYGAHGRSVPVALSTWTVR